MSDKNIEVENPLEPGFVLVTTGSTKHPDAEASETGKVEASITVFVGESVQDAIDKYGEEFVFDNYERSLVISAQNRVRRELDNGVPISNVEKDLDDLDPTEKRASTASPMSTALRSVSKMTPEEKAALLAQLQEA